MFVLSLAVYFLCHPFGHSFSQLFSGSNPHKRYYARLKRFMQQPETEQDLGAHPTRSAPSTRRGAVTHLFWLHSVSIAARVHSSRWLDTRVGV